MLDMIRRLMAQSTPALEGGGPAAAQQTEKDDRAVYSESILPPIDAVLLSELGQIVQRIESGSQVDTRELNPFLSLEFKHQRCHVNLALAQAYSRAGDLRQASIFIERAWLFSNHSPELLPLYVEIHSQLNDSAAVRKAYKRLGMAAARRGVISEAIFYFDKWHYTDAFMHYVDKYEFDFDIMEAMERLAEPHRRNAERSRTLNGRRLKIGYLLKGITEVNSILIRQVLTLAKFHDRSKFDLSFFCLEANQHVMQSEQGQALLEEFTRLGSPIYTGSDIQNADLAQVLIGVARKIEGENLDILVTTAALADFRHYFLTCLRPAPILIGLVQGPPPQFAPPNLDWCISWSPHPLIDVPANCSLVYLKRENSVGAKVPLLDRRDLGLSAEDIVLVSCGRIPKFNSPAHWQFIVDILMDHIDAHYLVVGATPAGIKCFSQVVPADLQPRIHFLGWRTDVPSVLRCADIMIDTYPSGGGQALVEAMLLGLPVAGHRNDFAIPFDPDNWSPIEDFVPDQLDTVVSRGDFGALKKAISRMITDHKFREQIATRCQSKVREEGTDVGTCNRVRNCEEIYLKVHAMHSR